MHANLILAQVPIDSGAFKPVPTWMLLTVAAVVGSIIVKRLGPHANVARGTLSTILDLVLDFFELGLIAAAVDAMAQTPLISSFQTAFMNAENSAAAGFAGHGLHISIDFFALGIVVSLAVLYAATESLIVGFFFGLAVLVLSGFSPLVAELQGWFINAVAPFLWNTFLAIVNYPFVHWHFTS